MNHKIYYKLFCFLFFINTLSALAKSYNLKALGADSSGKKNCTALIHKTIGLASKDGGGTLYFPEVQMLQQNLLMQKLKLLYPNLKELEI